MKFEKNKEYYEQLDKRTKEYKEYVAFTEQQSKGLGDTIAKVAEMTGIKSVVEKTAGALGYEDCGCDDRQAKINKIFRYERPECMEIDEFIFISEFFEVSRTRVTHKEQEKLLKVYNRVFKRKLSPTTCGGCLKKVVGDLKRLVSAHR